MSCNWIESPVIKRLKIPISTVTKCQWIKFSEGHGPWEIQGLEFMEITHDGCLMVGQTRIRNLLYK
jgi:hypothetical protein